MPDREDWRDLPLSSDVKRFIEATRQVHLDERRAMVQFAPVLCTCTRWYNWKEPGPPQLECMVHTTVMFDNGDWV